MQTKVNFWLRVEDRPKWEELKAKGIPICEILSRGINLVYKEETNAAGKGQSNFLEKSQGLDLSSSDAIIAHFAWLHFSDLSGHELIMNADFLSLVVKAMSCEE